MPAARNARHENVSSEKQWLRTVVAPGKFRSQYCTTSETEAPCDEPGKKLGCHPCSTSVFLTALSKTGDGFVRKICSGIAKRRSSSRKISLAHSGAQS